SSSQSRRRWRWRASHRSAYVSRAPQHRIRLFPRVRRRDPERHPALHRALCDRAAPRRCSGRRPLMRILLLTYGDPDLLPPTLSAARLLRARGFDVELIGARVPGRSPSRRARLDGVRVTLAVDTLRGLRGQVAYARFAAAVLARAAAIRP